MAVIRYATEDNIREEWVKIGEYTHPNYYIVLKRKGSNQEIKVERLVGDALRFRSVIVDLLHAIQAYQKAYGQKGSGRLDDRKKLKGKFDPATHTLKIKSYDTILANFILVATTILLTVLICFMGYDYSKYLFPRWHKLCSVDKEDGITDHRNGKKYSWEEITGPAKKLYELTKTERGRVIYRNYFFKYGFKLAGGSKCIFKVKNIGKRAIFYNVISIYKGEVPSPNWSFEEEMREGAIISRQRR